MNKSKCIFVSALFVFYLLNFSTSFAQTNEATQKSEPNYEVVLQTLITSNDPATLTKSVPSSLSKVIEKLKKNFGDTEYRLVSTQFGRVSDKGSFEYRGTLNELYQEREGTVYLNWGFRGINSYENSLGKTMMNFKSFSFETKIPRTKSGPIYYEELRIDTNGFNFLINEPTLIGTLTTPNPFEYLIVVLTVKPVS